MRKILFALFVIGAVVFSSCEKDQSLKPEVEEKINGVESKILCTGCGAGWDLNGVDNVVGTEADQITKLDSILNSKMPIRPMTRNN
ncbi:hypothetical protein [Daejeonella sp. H1SJ63]|uniref:hypothetical protein n=1 Tax=Daejeonella sp. H1SJ63 TaxID=3034145 RepID=UPI0023ECC601|nr:hypothetical protein [Daejeonella sp. H1SJ63]